MVVCEKVVQIRSDKYKIYATESKLRYTEERVNCRPKKN